MTTKASLFKLDSNVDGTYFDKNGDVQTIENMIQAVGGTDGPAIYPNSNNLSAPIAEDELDLTDLTVATNTLGHGILYDKNGQPIAYKGDLVIRDGLGNVIPLNKALQKAHTISEEGDSVYLRDYTLQEYNTSDKGVSLDDMISAAIQKVTALGGGNIVQAVRNDDTNTSSVSVYTVRLSANNKVWIVGSAMVSGPTTIQIRDVSTDTILDTGYVNAKTTNLVPVFVSYVGTLTLLEDDQGVTIEECQPHVWNSFLKRHFKVKDSEENQIVQSHQIALETVPISGGTTFTMGSINLLAMDDIVENIIIKNGEEVIVETDSATIAFDEELTSESYSITLQAQTPIQVWYDQKTAGGFRIKLERNYTGSIFWSAILKST